MMLSPVLFRACSEVPQRQNNSRTFAASVKIPSHHNGAVSLRILPIPHGISVAAGGKPKEIAGKRAYRSRLTRLKLEKFQGNLSRRDVIDKEHAAVRDH